MKKTTVREAKRVIVVTADRNYHYDIYQRRSAIDAAIDMFEAQTYLDRDMIIEVIVK